MKPKQLPFLEASVLKKILFLCAALFCAAESQADPIESQFPTEITVTKHWFSWSTDFSISTKDMKLGTVHRKFLTFEYQFFDNDEKLQASGRMRWFTWPIVFDVNDAEEQPIGRVEEKFSWFFPTFQFISPANMIQAEASLNFWRTTFTVVDPLSEEVIATMKRSFFRLKDDWTINIHNSDLFLQKEIDFRLFVVVMAFQTDREAWQRQKNKSLPSGYASVSSNEPKEKTDADISDSVEGIRTELEALRGSINPVEPKEEDFEAVDAIVTKTLSEESGNVNLDDASLSQLERGYKILLPLLTKDGLSPSQKSALFLMMDHHLKSIK